MSPNALPDTRCLSLLCWLGRIDGRRKAQKPLAASYKKAKSKGFKSRFRKSLPLFDSGQQFQRPFDYKDQLAGIDCARMSVERKEIALGQ